MRDPVVWPQGPESRLHSPDTSANIPVMAEGRYQILEIIGSGGMGEVCLADDVMLDRKVALKFVTAPGETDGEQLLVEARAAAALDHPFICSIYEVTTLNGRACIAMEYVRGESLERRLRGGPLPLNEALRVAEEIAEALDAAHKRRVVHRDLKPANVMLTEDGHIKVMDFGLAARLPHSDAIDQAMTVAVTATEDLIVGTPAYMAPEQTRGEPADRRSDIFSFGILLYELISGTNPFARANVAATFAAILAEPVATLRAPRSTIPPALDALVARLLAKDPAARLQSFGEARSALRQLSVDLSPSTSITLTGVADRADERRQRQTDRTRARARPAASEPESGEVRQRQPRHPSRRCGRGQNSTGRRRAGHGAPAWLPNAGRALLRAGGHARAHRVHGSPRRGLSADAGRGVSSGRRGKRARTGEADARAESPLPRPGAAAATATGVATTVPVHECPRVLDALRTVHAPRHLHRRRAVGGRVDVRVDAAPGPAPCEPPDRRHRGLP